MAIRGNAGPVFVDKIRNGATPADLPVEKALGITIPPHLLTRAEEVIQSGA